MSGETTSTTMELIAQFLTTQGWTGIVVLVLLLVIKQLYDRNNAIQDARIEEAREYAEVVKNNTISQNQGTEALKALSDHIRAQQDGKRRP